MCGRSCCWVALAVALPLLASGRMEDQVSRQSATNAMKAGNFKDAYVGFRSLLLTALPDEKAHEDLQNAINCLNQLGRVNEYDELLEAAIERHNTDWKLLRSASQIYSGANHSGVIVGGEFKRGPHRGGSAKYASSQERDRVRSLQLLRRAIELSQGKATNEDVAKLHMEMADRIFSGRAGWQLQALTDTKTLPDVVDQQVFWQRYYGRTQRAPVDENGDAVIHDVPKSWEASSSDGERWRWSLMQVAELNPGMAPQAELKYAQFLHSQFGVQTLGGMFSRRGNDNAKDSSWNVHTLTENETIARLATGPKRFSLPDEANPIKLFEQLAAKKDWAAQSATESLIGIFCNRQQYPRAAELLRAGLKKFGAANNWSGRLKQITGKWGRFENARVHAAGTGATVDLRFRNATEVKFEAKRIRIDKLIKDLRVYIQSKPAQLDGQKLNISMLGYRLVNQNQTQYVGDRVAAWDMKLTPPDDHFDDVVTVTTPLQDAGAYLLTAKIPGGNTSRIIVWLTDAAIVRKSLNRKVMYYVADARNGKPLASQKIDLLGYKQTRVERRRYKVDTLEAAATTNKDGLTYFQERTLPRDYTWLATTRSTSGNLAIMGFQRVWYGRARNFVYNRNKVFLVTDRPVYRPGQTVKYRFWVRNPRFDGEGRSFANMQFQLALRDGRGQEIEKKSVKTDELGSVTGEFELKADTTLGQYYVSVSGNGASGGGSFKVEEYKKPEYEVTVDSPERPIMLGEKAKVTVRANYYFGSPVTNATVRYKVMRTSINDRWYPTGPWDWLYGNGYGWFTVKRDWYPGSERWCCVAPYPWWLGSRRNPPEVVFDREVQIGEDGTVEFEIDTSVAKALHPDQDHRYAVTAEVVDRSRRTIVGSGSVVVAREPFDVAVWTNRGHYKAGDDIAVSIRAGSLDNSTVAGEAKVRLLKITYEGDKPNEAAVSTVELQLDDTGRASHRFRAAQTGQYRVSVEVTDDENRKVEGGQLFLVMGGKEDGAGFRFNDIELVPDKRDYQVGDTAELLISANQLDSTVLLFVRPENSVYPEPQVLRINGKSSVQNLKIRGSDMPNIFVEALTVANGKIHTEIRELYVPPSDQAAKVEVTSTDDDYRPGEKAELVLKLTGPDGKPFRSPTVVSVYDKSVEYISGGSGIPDIREFFWKVRRSHYQQTQSNLTQSFGNLLKRGESTLQHIGVFGGQLVRTEGALMENARGFAAADAVAGQRAAPMAAMEKSDDASGAAPVVEPTVRSQFADTAYWAASVQPDANGVATISFDLPDDLTTWKVRTWTVDKQTRVGSAETEFVTRKNLIVRMQAPRFFTESDEVVLSANVHNYLDAAKSVEVQLELDGPQLVATGALSHTVEVPADGEARIDWLVRVVTPGDAVVRMKALTNEESDAVERTFPVLVHGMLKTESWTGSIGSAAKSTSFNIAVPAKRRPEATELVVRYSPTLAGAMVDALPYLIDGPHNSTDGKLYRFLPSTIVQRVLQRTGVDLKAVRDKRANLNAQQLGDPAARAKQWKKYKRNPVFSNTEMDAIVRENLNAVIEMQLADGGWGWFSGWGERSTAHMTATVVHGLQIAKQNDLAIPDGVMDRGVTWLKRYENEQVTLLKNWAKRDKKNLARKKHASNLDAFVFMVLADAGLGSPEMQAYLYRDRNELAVCSKAMFGIALHKRDQRKELRMVLENISQFVESDKENQTAWLRLPQQGWWYWYGNDIETQAWYLKLLARTDAKGKLAAELARYIVNNRGHATWWGSIRDTAIAVESLAEFVVASGEFKPDVQLEILVDGQVRKQVAINQTNLFAYDDRLTLSGDNLKSGRHTVEIRKQGNGPLYYSAYLTNFTKEDSITATGLELKVQREFYKLIPEERSDLVSGSRGQALRQRGEKYRRERIVNFATVNSGDLIEVELVVDSKNDYDYIVLEDPKAAGFEAVDQTSGYTGNALGAYVEVRDNRVMLYVRNLARGKHSVSYRVRAEVPGEFSAMPTKVFGMYAPELKANSNESRVKIADSE